MKAIEKLKAKLARYPSISYSESPNSIEVKPEDESGFTVRLFEQSGKFTVDFGGWHETFDSGEEALNCFLFGLSAQCRLAVVYRGTTPTKWTVESLRDGVWVPDSETGFIIIPFWRRKRLVYCQNHLLPAPQEGDGADQP